MKTSNFNYQNYKLLSVVQFAYNGYDMFEFISAAQAVNKGMLKVEELSEGGSVNTIKVTNNSDLYVFFADGDILAGAKQNRILNTSVLLEPNKITMLPVSCVEAGRWGYRSREFNTVDYHSYKDLRAGKASRVFSNLKRSIYYDADQREIWNEVSRKSGELKTHSSTSNLSDSYDEKRESVDEYLSHFKAMDNANGAAFFIYDKLLNIDIFGRTDIYREYFNKFIRGSAFSALHLQDKNIKFSENGALDKTSEVLTFTENEYKDVYKGVGAGEEKRFEKNEITGFELVFSDNLIHKAVLNLNRV